MTKPNQTLYTNMTKTEYYLIPTGQSLGTGDFTIRTLAGEEKKVEEGDLTAFTISEEDAKKHIATLVGDGVEQLKTVFGGALEMFRQDFEAQRAARKNKEDVITSLLGYNEEDLQKNPRLAEDTLRNFFQGVQTIFEGTASQDPTRQEEARQQMRDFRAKLDAAGVETNDKMEILSDQLREQFFVKDPNEDITARTATLEKLAEQLKSLGNTLEEKLRQENERRSKDAA